MDDMFGMQYGGLQPIKQLLTAVSCNMIDTLTQLLNEEKVDIDCKLLEQNENTALHVCAQKGYPGCLQTLLWHGANPDCINRFGITPIAMALRYGHCKCVEILLLTGGNLSDPGLIWSSLQRNEVRTWIIYSPDVLQLLFVATPDFRCYGQPVATLMYSTFLRTVQSPELIKLFFLTGNRLPSANLHGLLALIKQVPNMPLYDWLIRFIKEVPSLQHQSRLAIRRRLMPNVLYAARLLPVPRRLQDFLLFPEVHRACQI